MREFTETLHTIMSAISEQLEMLPAIEGAIEEMTFTDEEERDDTRLAADHLLVETALEGEFDRLVYGLYGLTEEEIGIVEGEK
jgi:hypothetical protein